MGQAASAARRRMRATAAEGYAADEPHVREERGVQFVTDGAFYRKESAEVRTREYRCNQGGSLSV